MDTITLERFRELSEYYKANGNVGLKSHRYVLEFRCFECGEINQEGVARKEVRKRIETGTMKTCADCKEKIAIKKPENKDKLGEVLEKLENIEGVLVEILDKLNA